MEFLSHKILILDPGRLLLKFTHIILDVLTIT